MRTGDSGSGASAPCVSGGSVGRKRGREYWNTHACGRAGATAEGGLLRSRVGQAAALWSGRGVRKWQVGASARCGVDALGACRRVAGTGGPCGRGAGGQRRGVGGLCGALKAPGWGLQGPLLELRGGCVTGTSSVSPSPDSLPRETGRGFSNSGQRPTFRCREWCPAPPKQAGAWLPWSGCPRHPEIAVFRTSRGPQVRPMRKTKCVLSQLCWLERTPRTRFVWWYGGHCTKRALGRRRAQWNVRLDRWASGGA